MKVQSCSVSAETLKGAVLSDSDGDEIGVIIDIQFNLNRHDVVVMIWQENNGISGLSWESIKDWQISLQSPTWTFNHDSIVHKVSDAVENIVEDNSNPK